jgi:HEAT repeat protein
MNRRWVLLGLGVAVSALALAAWFEPAGRLRGWARGEAFHAGRPTSYWAARLGSADPEAQSDALWELREGERPADGVLTQILANPANPIDLRTLAAALLGELGPRGKSAVPALLEALDQPDPYLKAVAGRALSEVAPEDDEVLARLVPLLDGPQRLTTLTIFSRAPAGGPAVVEALKKLVEEDSDPAFTALAAEALGLRKALARPAVGPVTKALGHPDPVVRRNAAEALGRISGPDQEVIAALTKRLADSDAGVRERAARSLGWFGPDAKAAVPGLRKLLDDGDSGVRTRAAQALRRIDPPKVP